MRTSVSGSFTIAGRASSDFGAFLMGTSIPPIPNTRDNELELDGHTGIYDAGSEISRLDVTIQVGFWTNLGRRALKQQIRQFMVAIDPRNGYVPFIDGDDPNWVLNLKLTSTSGASEVLIAPGDTEVAATMTLQFKAADPHWYNPTEYPAVTTPVRTVGATITNPGSSTPLFITLVTTAAISGSGFVGLDVGGKRVQINAALWGVTIPTATTITVDTNTYAVAIGAANGLKAWTGDMPQLPAGNTSLAPVGSCNWKVAYTPRWLA